MADELFFQGTDCLGCLSKGAEDRKNNKNEDTDTMVHSLPGKVACIITGAMMPIVAAFMHEVLDTA